LWDVQDGVNEAFADVVEAARHCRFSNCAHQNEPGCAVRAAIAAGTLSAQRVESFRKLQQEQLDRATARRRSPSSVANQPGWRQRQNEVRRPGRIQADD
jgi:ribosome biogenesis GTPase / thiamine phosphate phosphatase